MAPVAPAKAELLATRVPVMVNGEPPPSNQMAAPWLTQVLPVRMEPGSIVTRPVPSTSMPPPASPVWLLLMTLALTVSVPMLSPPSRVMPAPSAVAWLLVMVSLLSTRLAPPWARMPPPEPTAPSPGAALPFWMVMPWKVTVSNVVLSAGLTSKTRLRPPPSMVTTPPLVLIIVRLLLPVMANSPAALSASCGVPRRLIL